MKLYKITLAAIVVLTAAVSAVGQERGSLSHEEQSQYVVSAKAGMINLVEGEVIYKRLRSDWDILSTGDNLLTGDSIKTGVDGRAEILLNPGSYLRLSENAEFIFFNTSLYSLKVSLLKGSAIIESAAIDEPITVVTPNGEYSIVERGLYRFDVSSDGKSEVTVRKGKVEVADKKIKKGKKAVIDGDNILVAKFNKKDENEFDLWSKDRAKTLIAANRRLSKNTLSSLLSGFTVSSFWLFDSRLGYCTFLPGYRGFSSPYGWGYSRWNPYWHWYNGYPNGYYSGGGRNVGNNGNSNGGNAGGTSGGGNTGGSKAGRPKPGMPGGDRGRGRGIGDRPSPPTRGSNGGVSAPRMPAPRAAPAPRPAPRQSPVVSSGSKSRGKNN